jgi:hypothetical protein
VPISWASNVLPVSDRVRDPGAGAEGMGPPGAGNADDNPEALGEPAFPPPLHAVTRTSGIAVATASNTRYRSATDHAPHSVPERYPARASEPTGSSAPAVR